MDQTVVLAITFIAGFLAIMGVGLVVSFLYNPIDRNIGKIRDLSEEQQGKKSSYIKKEKSSNILYSVGKKFAPKDLDKISATRKWLIKAGLYDNYHYYIYWGVKILLFIFLPTLLYAYLNFMNMPISQNVRWFVVSIMIPLFVVDFFILLKIKGRQEKIFCGLPDVLDLLVICIESGLGFQSAINKVCDEIHLTNKVLYTELKITVNSMRLSMSKEAALHQLGERTGVQDLKSLAAVIIQSEKFGTRLADALRVHSDDLRVRRRQRAEEMAQKTTVKLLFPLIIFIMPCIFVVVAGPAILGLIKVFG